jgi:hypothetical protein
VQVVSARLAVRSRRLAALLHFVIQAGIELVADDAAASQSLAIARPGLGLGAPWLTFAPRARPKAE